MPVTIRPLFMIQEIDDFVELTDHNPALGLLADHEYQETRNQSDPRPGAAYRD